MVVKVYISLTSGLKEVKKRQQKILMILDSKNINYEILDISEPGKEADKDFMHANSTSNGATASDTDPRHPLPPQVFNDDAYCGDFDQFELANEIDNLEVFLKLSPEEIPQLNRSTLDTSKIDESRPNGKELDKSDVSKDDDGEFDEGTGTLDVVDNPSSDAKKEEIVNEEPSLVNEESEAENDDISAGSDNEHADEEQAEIEIETPANIETTESEKLISSEQADSQ